MVCVCVCVCVCLCKHVCLFTQQHQHSVARMAVIFSEWFSPLGKWRENKSWVYMSHAEYTERKLFSFFLWTQFCSAAETSSNNSSRLELEGSEPASAVEVKSSQENLDYLKKRPGFWSFYQVALERFCNCVLFIFLLLCCPFLLMQRWTFHWKYAQRSFKSRTFWIL